VSGTVSEVKMGAFEHDAVIGHFRFNEPEMEVDFQTALRSVPRRRASRGTPSAPYPHQHPQARRTRYYSQTRAVRL